MIKLQNITSTFELNKHKIEVLKGIDLEIEDDEFIAIMGPSGSRKSTVNCHISDFWGTLSSSRNCFLKTTGGIFRLV